MKEQLPLGEERENTQNRVFEILEKKPEEVVTLETFEFQSTMPAERGKVNWHDDFLAFMEPNIRDSKILDLFCGTNSIKAYFKNRRLPGDVTGVDISREQADIRTDVAKIDKLLPPKKQFDVVCSLAGGVREQIFDEYLKDDGLLITESSDYVYKRYTLPAIEGRPPKGKDDFGYNGLVEKFKPMAVIKVLGINSWPPNKPKDGIYIIWKKSTGTIVSREKD